MRKYNKPSKQEIAAALDYLKQLVEKDDQFSWEEDNKEPYVNL